MSTSTSAKMEEDLKHSAKQFTLEAQLKLAEFSNSQKVSQTFDSSIDQATKFIEDDGKLLKEKAKEALESDLAKRLMGKSRDAFENSLRSEESIENAKRRAQQVLEIAESLALKSKGSSETATVFADAIENLKTLIETSENRHELAEAAGNLGKEVWGKLGSRASANSNVSSMKLTVDRLSERVRDLLRKLQEDKQKREEEAAMAAVMGLDRLSSPRGGMASGSDGGSLMNSPRTPHGGTEKKNSVNSRFKTLGEESQSIWQDIRGDEQISKLLREDIVPGFNSLIRNAVEVSCELISKLELPRVDGIYDSPIGSVCYHVDNLHFTEFSIDKGALRVVNHVNGERRHRHHNKNGDDEDYDEDYDSEEDDEHHHHPQFSERDTNSTGLHSTVEVRGIKTNMEEIEFAYCEHPRGWGVIDGEVYVP